MVPLFAAATQQQLPVQVWYCSSESLKETLDVQFGTQVKWDIPLLEGYHSEFITNNAKKPSIHNGFWGLYNKALIKKLKHAPPSLVIVPGWNYASYWMAILAAKWYGHQLALRGESPLNQELENSNIKRLVRKLILGNFLFKQLHYALYIGSQNKAFYKYYGVPESKLAFAPYSVDNNRFAAHKCSSTAAQQNLRSSLGLQPQLFTIVASGKYIHKKRPLTLLKAFHQLNNPHTQLVLVGDGELRPQLEAYIQQHQLSNVHLTGFVNQAAIVNYYAAASVFVMCSGAGETWGLSVNEAMNFDVPVIVTSIAGCATDLVAEGINGFIIPVDDVSALQQALQKIIALGPQQLASMGKASGQRIQTYSYNTIINTLHNLVAGSNAPV
jgi:glycosyltransferase involved in cell wall biosynthesis